MTWFFRTMSRIQRLRSAETGPCSAGRPVRIKTPFAARAGSAPKATSGTPTASKTTSISRDPFIVYTSNVFAILGFGWLYFALAEIVQMFHLIHYGLSAVLGLSRSKNNPDGLIQGSYRSFLCSDRRGSGLQYRSVFDMAASVSHFSSSKANRHKSASKLSGVHRPPLRKPRSSIPRRKHSIRGNAFEFFCRLWMGDCTCLPSSLEAESNIPRAESSVSKLEHPSLKPDATFFKCRNAGWSPFSMGKDSHLWVR